ncbi:PAS domain-containing protein [Asticcacaulis sp. 201]|uniref:PAS domain-containing protein n=1 Tax=Asticcacaulis sp. 201 TaxID=3028787 RepID=UPI002916E065|nr:PAS domain-containing protein [Asticcacaulis sp. 201]MDV6330155.1 PAS domain-containing protein [Asticcacaulis sp. 201]
MPYSKEISARTVDALMSQVLDAVVVIDAEGDVLAWNRLATEIFGWNESEALGHSLADLIVPPAHRDGHRLGMQRLAETGVARVLGRRIEITALHRDGHEFPIELSIVAAPAGGDAAFIGFIRDITARRASETRLVLSEESLRLTTDAAEIGTWDLDMATQVLTWSDRTYLMFGVPTGTPVTMDDFYAGLHPDDLADTAVAFLAALDPQTRSTYDVEFRVIDRQDRRVRWLAAKGKGIFDDSGQCVRAVGTAIDITARKRAEVRQSVLLELTDLLRSGNTAEALEAACALMGRHFGVSRVGFGQFDPVADVFDYTVCWTDGTVPPLMGDYPAKAFGEKIVARLGAGGTVVVNDLFADTISDEARTRETAGSVDTRAILVVPFLRGDRLRTIVYLNSRHARPWTADEVAFMEAVAERTRELIDRAEAEAALAAREAQFRLLAQAMPNHVWAAGPDGTVDWFNDQVYAYSGAQPGELDGGKWADIIHPDDVTVAVSAWMDAVKAGETYETQFRIRRADGVYRWHLIRAVPLHTPTGRISTWIGTNTDVEAQKSELNDTRDFVRLALGAVDGIGAWTFDVASDTFFFDDSVAAVYALPPGAGKTGLRREAFLANVHPEDMTALRATMAAGLKTAGELELEYRILHPDGSVRWVLSRGNTYFENGLPVRRIGIGVDMTDKRRLEEQLRQSQKMEAVGQLTGGIAHDFNNMLAVVMGSLDLLNRRVTLEDPRARHYVQSAADAAKRAANLTHRLLAFSRQQPLQPECIDPNRLVADMSDLLRHSIGADIRLETVLTGGAWRIEVDPNQLENVILNLSVNARDAMPNGGKLTIETQNAHLDARYVSSELGVPAGQYVMIAVTDTGSGMPDEVIAKAFDPFFTTKAVGKGTGLGLSQVYGFVKQSGGHIKIYSEVGHGTTIKIYLPRGGDADTTANHDVDNTLALSGDHRDVILVVDDEDAVRQFSADALEELGYRVLQADGAAAALQCLRDNPDVVMLFTDIVMPETNGRKLVDEALGLYPHLKVLYTTGYTRNAVVHNGVVDKGVELIGKPFSIDELAARVRALLDAS